jgi:D-alanine-D-alanine ligase
VLRNLNKESRRILPVGITAAGKWLLFGGENYADIAADKWEQNPANRTAFLSPERGAGLCILQDSGVKTVPVDVIFPVLHGENGEDGSIQGLFQLSGIPYVGCHVCAAAASMDKSVTKLIAATTGVRQANWLTLTRTDFQADAAAMCKQIMEHIAFPVFIKPCSTGSSVGVSKVKTEADLKPALENAFKYDKKILAEEFINGREIEVAVLGNDDPKAATAGEISGKLVKSPIVGTFYAAPSPDKPPFVRVGDEVKKGDVIMIIESMKLMNEIQSEYDGIVDKILVSDGQAVEYDQPVMVIK